MASPSGDLIGIDFEGDAQFQAWIKQISDGRIRDEVTDDVSKYLLNVLRAYPPYHGGVTRTSVYGAPFKTDKQRRWFFANLREGTLDVPYHRTQALSDAWQIVGSGEKAILVNDMPYAGYAYGTSQNRLLAAIGWKKLPAILKEREARIKQIIKAAVKKALRKR